MQLAAGGLLAGAMAPWAGSARAKEAVPGKAAAKLGDVTPLADQTTDNTGIRRNALSRNAPACSSPAS